MAKIKEIQLKALKSFNTHDGQALNANLYYKNKKVGSIEDEGYGGGLFIHVDSKEVKKELIEVALKYYEEHPAYFVNPEITDLGKFEELIEELLLLMSGESTLKKNVKNGFTTLILLESHKRDENPFPYQSPIWIGVKEYNDETKLYLDNKYPKYKERTIYKSLDDFIIK